MRVWRLSSEVPDGCARLLRRGTWIKPPEVTGTCEECTRSFEVRVSPLLVEWDPESGDSLADVTDAGFASDFVLSANAVSVLEEFCCWHAGPVEVVNPSPLLSFGVLSDLLADLTVSADLDASSIEVERRCGTCGTVYWRLRGASAAAWKSSDTGPPGRGEDARSDVGIVVRKSAVGTADIFKVEQVPAWTLVSDTVRNAMTETGLTGARFFEVGSLID
jgi:hypothetical protein